MKHATKTTCTKESGQCRQCQAACGHKPGWFMPREAEKVAKYLGISLEELFASKLAVDWWVGGGVDDGDIFVLSPAITTSAAGVEFPGDPQGQCVFYQEGRCSIHPVKPFECAQAVPCHGSKQPNYHEQCSQAWNTTENQAQIVQLLGRRPEAEEYVGGLFGMLGF